MVFSKAYSKCMVYGILIGNLIYNGASFKDLLETGLNINQGLSVTAFESINTIGPIVLLLFTVALMYCEKFILLSSTIMHEGEKVRTFSKPHSYLSLAIHLLCAVIFMNAFVMLLQVSVKYLFILSSPIGKAGFINFSNDYASTLIECILTLFGATIVFLFNSSVLKKHHRSLSKGL